MSSVSLALVILKNDVKLGLTEVFELKWGGGGVTRNMT